MPDPLFHTAFNEALFAHRRKLDALDDELIMLLAKRFSITHQIGELKAVHRAPAADPEREQAQLGRLLSEAERLCLAPEVVRVVFAALFTLVRNSHVALAAQLNADQP